jgi:hypothetical protein
MVLEEDPDTFTAFLGHQATPFCRIDIPKKSSGKMSIGFKHLCATQFATSLNLSSI